MNVPLLAAGWEGLGPLLLVVFWVIKYLLSAKQEERETEDDYELLQDEPDRYDPTRDHEEYALEGSNSPSSATPVTADPVQSEVQEFLRKIERMQHPQAAPQQSAPPVELILDKPKPARRAKLGALSKKHLPQSQLAEQAAHLGERIAHADDRIDARLHKKFDHQIGQFQHEQTTGHRHEDSTKAEPSTAARVAKMLTTPGGMRDAVILHEILRRPSD